MDENPMGTVADGEEAPRPAAQSAATQVQIVLPQHANSNKRLFGGVLMQWVDIVAGVAARRHAGREVTTACIDRLEFEAPAFVGDTIQLDGMVTYVGRTSMEVRVDTFVESYGRHRRRINRAYLVLVAIDGDGNPCGVPALAVETAEQEREREAGEKRRELRRRRREEQY